MAHSATQRADAARILHTHIHTLRRCGACVPQPHACTGLCKQLNIHVECPQVRERAATMPKDDAGRGSTVRHVWRERALLRALCPELGSSYAVGVCVAAHSCLWAQLKTYVKRPTLPMSAQPHCLGCHPSSVVWPIPSRLLVPTPTTRP